MLSAEDLRFHLYPRMKERGMLLRQSSPRTFQTKSWLWFVAHPLRPIVAILIPSIAEPCRNCAHALADHFEGACQIAGCACARFDP